MYRTKFLNAIFLVEILIASLWFVGCKKREQPAEHPQEHPTATVKKTAVTKDELADAIEDYVNRMADAHEGYFPITDDQTGKSLDMALVKVHRERLAKLGKEHYFACVDFETPEGIIYDVDFFMKGPDKDSLTFSEFMIHKVDGVERYTWYEEGGLWKRKLITAPVELEPEPAEEPPPEHPEEHPSEHPTEHPR